MTSKYTTYFELIKTLATDSELIATPQLYQYDREQVYTNTLDNLAQPLADGSSSPFSARNPFSAEGILIGQILNLLEYSAWREANLIPEFLLLSWFKALGLTKTHATPPVVELTFTRTQASLDSGEPAVIPLGLQVRSRFYSDRIATVQERIEISEGSGTVSARINSLGQLTQTVRDGEFTLFPANLSDIASVTNSQLLSDGQDEQTISDLVSDGISALSRPGDRVVTARDYVEVALNLGGADQATVLPHTLVAADGSLGSEDILTVAVYPEGSVELVRAALADLVMAGVNYDVASAILVPIDGDITVRIDPQYTKEQAFDLLASSIVDNINPPNATFGDLEFSKNLAAAIEQVRGILAVPTLNLKHALTNQPLEEMEVLPHWLFEVQASLVITYI